MCLLILLFNTVKGDGLISPLPAFQAQEMTETLQWDERRGCPGANLREWQILVSPSEWKQQRGRRVFFIHFAQNWILTLELNFCKALWGSTEAVWVEGRKGRKTEKSLSDGEFPLKQSSFGKWTERSYTLPCYLLTYMYTKSVAASLGIGQKTRCNGLVWLCRKMDQW